MKIILLSSISLLPYFSNFFLSVHSYSWLSWKSQRRTRKEKIYFTIARHFKIPERKTKRKKKLYSSYLYYIVFNRTTTASSSSSSRSRIKSKSEQNKQKKRKSFLSLSIVMGLSFIFLFVFEKKKKENISVFPFSFFLFHSFILTLHILSPKYVFIICGHLSRVLASEL